MYTRTHARACTHTHTHTHSLSLSLRSANKISSTSFLNIYRFKSVHNITSKRTFKTNTINTANADIIIFFITCTTVFCHYLDHWMFASLFFKFLKFRMSRWHFTSCSIRQKFRNSLGCRICLGRSCTATLGIYYVIILCSRPLLSKPDLLFCVTNCNYDLCVHQFEFASYRANIFRRQTAQLFQLLYSDIHFCPGCTELKRLSLLLCWQN
jgi:hypothetical protein